MLAMSRQLNSKEIHIKIFCFIIHAHTSTLNMFQPGKTYIVCLFGCLYLSLTQNRYETLKIIRADPNISYLVVTDSFYSCTV